MKACLVGERVGHDERRVSSGTSEIDETSLSEKDHVTAILESVTIHLQSLHLRLEFRCE